MYISKRSKQTNFLKKIKKVVSGNQFQIFFETFFSDSIDHEISSYNKQSVISQKKEVIIHTKHFT